MGSNFQENQDVMLRPTNPNDESGERRQIGNSIFPVLLSSTALIGVGAFLGFSDQFAQFAAMKPIVASLSGICAIGSLTLWWQSTSHTYNAEEQEIEGLPINDSPETKFTDSLTGLGNHLQLEKKFNRLIADGAANGFSVGIVDIDNLRSINDIHGFEGGDIVLRQCGQRLRAAMEEFGFVYRYVQGQFSIVLPNINSAKEIKKIGILIKELLSAPFDVDQKLVRINGSMGFTICESEKDTFENAMENIGTALINSKQKGNGHCTIFDKELEASIIENTNIERALREAITNEDITPFFQPVISLEDGRILGFESLARWTDPVLGFVSPGKFIPLAEERGLITELTEVLLRKAAKVAASWPDDIFLSFNLSSVQLVEPSTAVDIFRTIEKCNLPPHRLEIEVTETAMMSDPQMAEKIIGELHDGGIRISMDDFGTGQSSLGRLRDMQLDKVKIDRAFIMNIAEDKTSAHIVKAILEMCAGLQLKVVAEGIEELNQAEILKSYRCDAAQGYLFGKPQDAVATFNYISQFNLDKPPARKIA